MKKFCIVMALCSALTFTEVFADRSFSDLPDSHWAYGVVQQLVDAGRINGYPDGSFQPDSQVTRWEFAKMAGGNPMKSASLTAHQRAMRLQHIFGNWQESHLLTLPRL